MGLAIELAPIILVIVILVFLLRRYFRPYLRDPEIEWIGETYTKVTKGMNPFSKLLLAIFFIGIGILLAFFDLIIDFILKEINPHLMFMVVGTVLLIIAMSLVLKNKPRTKPGDQ